MEPTIEKIDALSYRKITPVTPKVEIISLADTKKKIQEAEEGKATETTRYKARIKDFDALIASLQDEVSLAVQAGVALAVVDA